MSIPSYTLNSTDANGRATSVTYGNGRTETRDFDFAAGYLTNIQTNGSVQNLTMTYDEVGNVLTRQDSLISKTESFTYDAVNRLTGADISGISDIDIVYSPAGRIESKTGIGNYTYGAGSAGPFAVTSANGLNYTFSSVAALSGLWRASYRASYRLVLSVDGDVSPWGFGRSEPGSQELARIA